MQGARTPGTGTPSQAHGEQGLGGAGCARRAPSRATCSGPGAGILLLRFKRWLTVDGDLLERARIGVLRGGEVSYAWKQHRRIDHIDHSWVPCEIELGAALDGHDSLKVVWLLRGSLLPPTLGGWNLDDVEVVFVQGLDISR